MFHGLKKKGLEKRLACSASALFIAVLLSGCASQPSPPDMDASSYREPHYGVTLDYDSSLIRIDQPVDGYFDQQGWNAFSDTESQGKRLLMLELPGSNKVTTARWQLGVSRGGEEVYNCLGPPASVDSEKVGTATIDGHRFITFEGGDAGMSHYRHIKSYRSVISGTCYAIDLVIQGTPGGVYDPPRQPPFDRGQALARLQSINQVLKIEPGADNS